MSVQSIALTGANAFYNAPNYVQSTRKDFEQTAPLPPSFRWDTELKIIRIAKQILSIIFFPIAIYQFLHALCGKLGLLPASTPFIMGRPSNYGDVTRAQIPLDEGWKYKRLTIEVDGYQIDAVIVGTEGNLGNGRWVLASNGNGQFYEEQLVMDLPHYDFKQILTELNANAIVFNYPGVGASSGLPNKEAMAKAYRAVLTFLEEEIRAQEIIGYGHSIGGGTQGEALKTHALKKDIKYVFVKSRTFSDLTTTATLLTNKFLGFLVQILGWNMDSVESSKKLQAPEIILQTAHVPDYAELTDSQAVIHDGVIPAEASLAKALLDDPNCPRKNKVFIGMNEDHNEGLRNPAYLAGKIIAKLENMPQGAQ